MSTPSPAAPAIGFRRDDDHRRAADALRRVGFTHRGVSATLHAELGYESVKQDRLRHAWRALSDTPLHALVNVFMLGLPAPARSFAAAVAPTTPDAWAQAGLIGLDGDAVAGRIDLRPLPDFWLAADREPCEPQDVVRRDHVMGAGTSTLKLSLLTIRRRVGSVLDMGAGGGFMAMLAAKHAGRVVASDISPRAADFARFNARLNAIDNIEPACGDLFAPVSNQRFDLIVSNPPYVISPESSFIYRDGGMTGDTFIQRFIREAPAAMSAGGFCQFGATWAEHRGEDWKQRLRGWFDGAGCDVWVMREVAFDPGEYAAAWVDPTRALPLAQRLEAHRQWMRCYGEQSIQAISTGFVFMRRREASSSRFVADDAMPQMLGACGDDVLRRFETRDRLDAMGDDGLLNAAPHVDPATRLTQQLELRHGRWSPAHAELTRTAGFATTAEVDALVAAALSLCNGQRTMREIAAAMAQNEGLDVNAVTPALLNVFRVLIERGFVRVGG
jgi:SAM-dependent methyltransferase